MKQVDSKNYVENVLRTESCDMEPIIKRLTNPKTIRLLHATLGIAGEAGELVEMLKKHIFYGKPIDEINAQEEIGDGLWYVGVAVDVLKTTMNDILTKNIEKLRKRYPEKFTINACLNRDKENELSHF